MLSHRILSIIYRRRGAATGLKNSFFTNYHSFRSIKRQLVHTYIRAQEKERGTEIRAGKIYEMRRESEKRNAAAAALNRAGNRVPRRSYMREENIFFFIILYILRRIKSFAFTISVINCAPLLGNILFEQYYGRTRGAVYSLCN